MDPPSKLKNWTAEAAKYAKALTPERAAGLAANLGLPVEAVAKMEGVGYMAHAVKDEHGEWVFAWTMSERNAHGVVTAINRRFPRPVSIGGGKPSNKAILGGGTRGLYLPIGWRDRPGPLVIPAGGSDVMALSLCEVACVGRSSDLAGFAILAALLQDVDRDLIVMGENDPKPDGKTPGRDGAIETAMKLTKSLNRPVKWSMPPDGTKDARTWVQDLAKGFGEVEDWPGAGLEIVRHLSDVAVSVQPTPTPAPPTPKYDFIPSDVFIDGDYRLEWLAKQFLVKREPAVIGGPSKALKTNVAVDLCVSLATGTPVLGHFDVPERARVAIASGESGKPTLKETFKRVCKAKNLNPREMRDWLHWCFNLPGCPTLADMGEFVDGITACRAEFVLLDPLYLMLGPDVDEKSMFKMGGVLKNVAVMLVDKGVQPLFVHHANRKLEKNEPMELQHLAYSGLDQFARQFILISRRETYDHDGNHKLWLVVGGSAGFTGKYGCDINEGVQGDDFTGRVWEPVVANVADLRKERETRKAEEKSRQRKKDETTVLQAVDSLTTRGKAPTMTKIREFTALSLDRANGALDRLIEDDILVVRTEEVGIGSKAARDAEVYRRKGSGQPSSPSGIPDGPSDYSDGRDQPSDHHPDTPSGGPGVSQDGHSPTSDPPKQKTQKARRRTTTVPDGQGAAV